jgi:CubicO group peptidase (beta-lactamase class C family)
MIKIQTLFLFLFLIFQSKANHFIAEEVIDSNLCLFKNKENLLPLDLLNRKILNVSYGDSVSAFNDEIELYASVQHIKDSNLHLSSYEMSFNDILLVTFNLNEQKIDSSFASHINNSLNRAHKEKVIAIFFGYHDDLSQLPLQNVDALILSSKSNIEYQKQVAEIIFGSIGISSQNTAYGLSLNTISNGRLRFSTPEKEGLNPRSFDKIGTIANHGIEEGAFPGCQILVASKGSIIYRESFGKHTYDDNSKEVINSDVYDIASITKIASSTLMAMYLEHRNMLDIDDTLGKYIPDLTENTPFAQIKIREMLAHQSGLKSWIPFYLKTMSNWELKDDLYRTKPDSVFDIEVANNIYLKNDYPEIMFERILSTNLGDKKYKYSDLCYYFTQKVFESILNENQETFVHEMIYEPLGLRNIRYLPLNHFEKERIVPTEHDTLFRKQLIHGYVHDPGAAMLGGVGGHAGVFSNTTDLASIMQLFLHHGDYAGQTLFTEELIKDYTRKQYDKNRRGAGFDRPREKGGGTCDVLASQSSFGHSGFTGALAWADPEHDIIFVFLSNRVHPNQENWKIRDMNIRTDIQHVVYQALGVQ